MADVILRDVTKRFGQVTAVERLSLSISDGEFVALLGPTGVGKTTTLRLVAGLEQVDSGRIEISGQDITSFPPAPPAVALVFHQYSPPPPFTPSTTLPPPPPPP